MSEHDDETEERDVERSLADRLIDLAMNDVALLHSPDGKPWAFIESLGETMPVEGGGFRRWLRHTAFRATNAAPGVTAINTAIETLSAWAVIEAPEEQVFTRVGARDHCIYLDLGGDDASAVEIDGCGWRIVNRPPVRFQRPRGSGSLPPPERGGSLRDLSQVLNIADVEQSVLISAWLAAALRPSGPYPVLVLRGPPGSAKSTAATFIRQLIDPAKPATRSLPRNERDLFIHAVAAHLLSFDNLSYISPALSDALCRIATGGGYASRRLRTDADEAIFDAQRPILLNGLDGFVVRGDLIDRAIDVELEPLQEARRRTERDVRADFTRLQPLLIGALLDAVATGLSRAEAIGTMNSAPRMADFYAWSLACEPALGGAGSFARAFEAARRAALPGNLESNPLAAAVLRFLQGQEAPEWSGSASELLAAINPTGSRAAGLPTTANHFSQALNLAAPLLQFSGWALVRSREATPDRTRRIILRKLFSPG